MIGIANSADPEKLDSAIGVYAYVVAAARAVLDVMEDHSDADAADLARLAL